MDSHPHQVLTTLRHRRRMPTITLAAWGSTLSPQATPLDACWQW